MKMLYELLRKKTENEQSFTLKMGVTVETV